MGPKLSRIFGAQKVLQLKNCCIALIESASWPMLQARASTRLRPSACTFAICAFSLAQASGFSFRICAVFSSVSLPAWLRRMASAASRSRCTSCFWSPMKSLSPRVLPWLTSTTLPPDDAPAAIAVSHSSRFCDFGNTGLPSGLSQSALVADGVGSTGNRV